MFLEANPQSKNSWMHRIFSLLKCGSFVYQSFFILTCNFPLVKLINVILKNVRMQRWEASAKSAVVWNKWKDRWGIIHTPRHVVICVAHRHNKLSVCLYVTRWESCWRPLEEAWWSRSGWLGLSALFISGRMEVEESLDLLVCYQLTTIGHLLPASIFLLVSLSLCLHYLSPSLNMFLRAAVLSVYLTTSVTGVLFLYLDSNLF